MVKFSGRNKTWLDECQGFDSRMARSRTLKAFANLRVGGGGVSGCLKAFVREKEASDVKIGRLGASQWETLAPKKGPTIFLSYFFTVCRQ
jgi:hypothetical protein